MIQQRDVFRNELRFVLEEELGKYGIYFYLFDFELGIPSHTNPECVIRMCLNAIEACTIFVGIIGKTYGTTIQSFVENIAEREKLKKEYPVLADAIDRNVSVLELEFLYAMYLKPDKSLFFAINDKTINQSNEIINLRDQIRQYTCRCEEIQDYKEIKGKVVQWILDMIHNMVEGIKPSRQKYYVTRKTKYYVEDGQISEIYEYIEGSSSKPLCIYGDRGSGKTVMMARMYLEQQFQGMCFAFGGNDVYTLSEVILLLLKQLYEYYGMPAAKLDAVYSEREYVQLFQETIREISTYEKRCCLLIDGIDKIHILGAFSIKVILPDKLPKNVKVVLTTNNKAYLSEGKVSFLQHVPVDTKEIIVKTLDEEGKLGEIELLKSNLFFQRRTKMSLEYIYVFLSELMVDAKYNTLKEMLYKQAFYANSLIILYTSFLQRMSKRFPNKLNTIKKLMVYLTHTENGLTVEELDLLIDDVDHEILAFAYPYLEMTGEDRMLISSAEFREAVWKLWKVTDVQLLEYRKSIVNICVNNAREDPLLGREVLYQLSYIREETFTESVLNNIQVVDSITYYNEEYAFHQLQKLPHFEKVLQKWSEITVTEENYIYLLTVVNYELDHAMTVQAQRHLEEMLVLLQQNKIRPVNESNIYNHLAVLYTKKLEYDKAYRYAEEALETARKNREDQFVLCEYGNLICSIFLDMGYVDRAYDVGRRLFKYHRNPYFQDTAINLKISITLLHVLNAQDRNREYQRMYARILPRAEAVFGKTHSEVIDIKILNINHLIKTGNFECALNESDTIMTLVTDQICLMQLLLVKCDIYYHMRKWRKEEKLLMQVGDLLEQVGKEEIPEVTFSWYEKCIHYYIETGKPQKAVKIGENIRKEYRGLQYWEIFNYLDVGAAYEKLDMNERAMECYSAALKIFDQSHMENKRLKADIYNNIGSCSHNMQQYKKSYNAYKEGINIMKECPDSHDELYGILLNNMGQLMQEMHRSQEALIYYRKAIKKYQASNGDRRGNIINAMDNMGSIYDAMEEYRKAAYFHFSSSWYRIRNEGLYTPSTVTSLHNLANTFYISKNYFLALIIESLAVQGLRKQEFSVDDYPIYLNMGKTLENMHLGKLAFRYYVQTYCMLKQKQEIVSETVEICLILATFGQNWEENTDSIKKLSKAAKILKHKKELFRKDYELKLAIYFCMEIYYDNQRNYDTALKCLDLAEKVIISKLGRDEYSEFYQEILNTREEIKKKIEDIAAFENSNCYSGKFTL